MYYTNITSSTKEDIVLIKLERIEKQIEEVKVSLFICTCFIIAFIGFMAINIVEELM